jgi:hypothetical protein
MPPTKRSTPFQEKHAVQYGLEIARPETKTVTLVIVTDFVFLGPRRNSRAEAEACVCREELQGVLPSCFVHSAP